MVPGLWRLSVSIEDGVLEAYDFSIGPRLHWPNDTTGLDEKDSLLPDERPAVAIVLGAGVTMVVGLKAKRHSMRLTFWACMSGCAISDTKST